MHERGFLHLYSCYNSPPRGFHLVFIERGVVRCVLRLGEQNHLSFARIGWQWMISLIVLFLIRKWLCYNLNWRNLSLFWILCSPQHFMIIHGGRWPEWSTRGHQLWISGHVVLKVGGWSYCVYILEWNCIVFLWLGVYATYTDVYTTPLYHVAGYPITSRVSSYCPVVTLVVAHSLLPTPDIYLEYEQYHAVVCFKADPLHKFTICLSYNLWHMSPLAWNFIDLCFITRSVI